MNIDITGKVVAVTGAARGIGRTLALGLAREGARVAVLARDRARAQHVVELTTFLCSDAANHLSGSVIMVRPTVNR